MTRIDAVVVTHESSQVIGAALDSLALASGKDAGVDLRVTVVDNASSDGTADLVAAGRWPGVTVVRLPTNAGYAAALNRGVRAVRGGSHLLALNADVVVLPGALEALAAAVAVPGVGVAAPRLVHPGPGGEAHHSVRRPPSVCRAWGDALLGGRRAGRWPAVGETVVDPAVYASAATAVPSAAAVPVLVDAGWLVGAALLVARPCLDAVGPFDERFFLYSEDTDYCLRARAARWRCVLAPAASMIHAGGDSQDDATRRAHLAANRVRLYGRGRGWPRTVAFGAGVLANEVLRSPTRPECRASTRRLAGAAARAVLAPRRRG